MRLFRNIVAEYTCSEFCGYRRSVVSAAMSRFHFLVAIVFAILFCIYFVREPYSLPWYYSLSFLAGELLLIFTTGFLGGILLSPFLTYGTNVCRKCGAPVFCAGQHYDPLGSPKPHWTDIAIFIFVIAINAAIWFALIKIEVN